VDVQYVSIRLDISLNYLKCYHVASLFPLAHSRSTFFFIFPVLVLGSSSTTTTSLGTINLLISLLCFAQSTTSSPLSCSLLLTVTKA
jgi:hypothetical protein